MPGTKRIALATAVLLAALAVLAGYVVATITVGEITVDSEFKPGTGPAPMVGPAGPGLHLPLGGE